MTSSIPPEAVQHGTYKGYQWELKHGLETCRECRDARNKYMRDRRALGKRDHIVGAKRRLRAQSELVRRHRAEYEEILAGISWLETTASIQPRAVPATQSSLAAT